MSVNEWLQQFVQNSTDLCDVSHRQQYLDPRDTLTDHWRVSELLEVTENNLLRALCKVFLIVFNNALECSLCWTNRVLQ